MQIGSGFLGNPAQNISQGRHSQCLRTRCQLKRYNTNSGPRVLIDLYLVELFKLSPHFEELENLDRPLASSAAR